ncbi:urea ABC transporter ATP-binding protein UrtD [Nibricoccus aquaticus]|uniref:Urea ABC transporter ATP-binding protein UrtD n=1 Tax=Nibricoccus aquaticus TaxID=2576891 RepID=A0A290QLX7_9BACT|nr:urea ABC transporter ATP-binding protein UrtD [Nibricoccus aquaticus]ATC65082.1 urea ABC transporter ATP-binding protein UrtD [Nibricoccus aquaticus]
MPSPILAVEDVSKTYDGFKAITNLNFYLDQGELRTVIGPNGAGKSTFFDLISGRAKPNPGGKITFGDIDVTQRNEYEINRIGIGRKFQTPSVYSEHTVFDNLVLSLKGPRGVFSSLFKRLNSGDRDRLDDLLKLIRLDDKRSWKAGQLAHGEKQWLEIGMLLASEPKLLLIDEPAAGMTDAETHRTGELLLSLAGKHSLIVVEHDMGFVRQIASNGKVTVLHQGSVLCEGKFDEVQNNQKVREVYLGRGKH